MSRCNRSGTTMCRKRNGPCDDSLGLQHPDRSCYRTYRRPDVVVLDKHDKMCHLIDIAVPGNSRVASKENEKVQKYQD